LIVISGALAVVAFVLLIAGLVADGLGLVYASIAVSLISAIFLGVGAYQRRGEEVAPRAATEPSTAGLAAEPVRVGAPAETAAFSDAGDESSVRIASGDGAGAASGGQVYVVVGRPRYHIDGCRYLAGKDGEPRSLAEARNEGYTACGICRPDENVSAAPELALVGGGADDDDDDVDDYDDAKPAHTEVPRRTAAQRRTAATGTPLRKTTAKKSAATKTTAKKAATRKAAPSRAAAKKTTAKKASAKKATARKAAPARATAKKTSAKKATARKAAPTRATAKKASAKKTAKKAAKKSTRR
jgi:hypothetical protein